MEYLEVRHLRNAPSINDLKNAVALAIGLLLPTLAPLADSEAGPITTRGVDPRVQARTQAGDPRRAIRSEDLPLRITASGSYYLAESVDLANSDIFVDKSITFAADDVTLDLMGFTLASNCIVLKSEAGSENLLIHNGIVKSLECRAIELESHVRLVDITAYAGGTATWIRLGRYARIIRTRGVASDDGTGIRVGDNSIVQESSGKGEEDGSGIVAGRESLILNCQGDASGFGTGIAAGARSVIQGSTANGNYLAIGGGEGVVIIDSTANAASEYRAVSIGSGGSVRNSTVRSGNVGIEAVGDGIIISNNTCAISPSACILVEGSNNRIEKNVLEGGRIFVNGTANVVTGNLIGGLIQTEVGGGAIEIAGARNLVEENIVTGAECGILFNDDGGHLYRNNVFLVASQAICGSSNVDGGGNVFPAISICGDDLSQGTEVCDGVDLEGRSCFSEGFEGPGLACNASCDGFDTSSCSASICGSGTRRGAEVCDFPDLGGTTCLTLGFNGGRLKCSPGCTSFDTSECCCTDGRPGCPICLCGNGIIDPQEACDGLNLSNQTCISRGFEAGILACNTSCTAYDDSGCVADGACGNGIREIDEGEECDGTDLGGASCVTRGFDVGALACRRSCEFDTTGCAWVCGNGVRRGGAEVCDGTDLNGKTCSAFGFDAGTLGCRTDCSGFDLSGCVTVCGNEVRSGNETCDGTDVGDNTCQAQGYDAGTLSCSADCGALETDGCCCTGGQEGCTACPVCGNGVREAPFELCDGQDLGGETCSSQGRPPGTLGCNSTCDGFVFAGCEGFLRSPKRSDGP